MIKVCDIVILNSPFRVFQVLNKNMYDICNNTGSCLRVYESEIFRLTLTKLDMKIRVDAVKKVANELIAANGITTTLEIKDKLIKDFPIYYWEQDYISATMMDLQNKGKFQYTDTVTNNVSHRVYFANKPGFTKAHVDTSSSTGISNPIKDEILKTSTKSKKISRDKALGLIQNSKGHFFTAVFVKSGWSCDKRTINCQYMKNQDKASAGCVMVKESGRLKTGVNPIRQINIGTLQSLSIGGQNYKVS